MSHAPRGPRRVWNPPNPFLTEHREFLGEPPVADLEVWEERSRSILSRNDSPDLGFRWSVNPYRGCFHACAYCYARPTHEYLGMGSGTDFERKIVVKPDAPELLSREISRPAWKGEMIAFSGVTDPYQPLEAAWRLTRKCLEVLAARGNPVGIVTKSALVRRDEDILEQLAKQSLVRVMVSIPFLDEKMCRLIEPGAATVHRRFETIRVLAGAGIPVGVAVAPIIPGLNDSDVPEILKEAVRCGATSAFRTLLRLPGSVKEVFFQRLGSVAPLRAERVERRIRETRDGRLNDSRFGARHSGTGPYWDAIQEMWDLWTRRLGLPASVAPPTRRSDPARTATRHSEAAKRPATQQELPL